MVGSSVEGSEFRGRAIGSRFLGSSVEGPVFPRATRGFPRGYARVQGLFGVYGSGLGVQAVPCMVCRVGYLIIE